jgi:hypothetical protein
MVWRILATIFALAFATPSRSNPHSIGLAAGNGGWNVEDSNHYRA